jgi:hypothetical protein
MSTNDYVKFVTQQIVSYMDSPKEKRKSNKQERKNKRAPFLNRWFGVLPFAFKLLFRRNKR